MLTPPPLCACAAAGKHRYYLALNNSSQGNYSSNVAFYFVYLVTYWLLFSYLVPISLFVTIEIVKFVLVRLFWACCSLRIFLLVHILDVTPLFQTGFAAASGLLLHLYRCEKASLSYKPCAAVAPPKVPQPSAERILNTKNAHNEQAPIQKPKPPDPPPVAGQFHRQRPPDAAARHNRLGQGAQQQHHRGPGPRVVCLLRQDGHADQQRDAAARRVRQGRALRRHRLQVCKGFVSDGGDHLMLRCVSSHQGEGRPAVACTPGHTSQAARVECFGRVVRGVEGLG